MDNLRTHPFFVSELASWPKILNFWIFVIMDTFHDIYSLKSFSESYRALHLMTKDHRNRYWVHPFFGIDKTLSEIQILECYDKTVTGLIFWTQIPIDAQESTNKDRDGQGMNFRHISGNVKNWQKSKTVKVLQKSSLPYWLIITSTNGFIEQLLIENTF